MPDKIVKKKDKIVQLNEATNELNDMCASRNFVQDLLKAKKTMMEKQEIDEDGQMADFIKGKRDLNKGQVKNDQNDVLIPSKSPTRPVNNGHLDEIPNNNITQQGQELIDSTRAKQLQLQLQSVSSTPFNDSLSSKWLLPAAPAAGGASPKKTLKFYQALARSRKIPFKNLKKNELIRLLKA